MYMAVHSGSSIIAKHQENSCVLEWVNGSMTCNMSTPTNTTQQYKGANYEYTKHGWISMESCYVKTASIKRSVELMVLQNTLEIIKL